MGIRSHLRFRRPLQRIFQHFQTTLSTCLSYVALAGAGNPESHGNPVRTGTGAALNLGGYDYEQ